MTCAKGTNGIPFCTKENTGKITQVVASPDFTSLTWSAAAAVKSLQSCPTLCNPINSSSPGSTVPGILQASILVHCHFLLQCMKVKSESEVTQLCQTLRDPMDCSPPGSSVHGIFQARVLECVASAFSAYMVYMLANTENVSPLT